MKRAGKRVTPKRLTEALENVGLIVQQQSGLLDSYHDAIEGTAFLRLASMDVLATSSLHDPERRIEQVCLDSFVLLLVTLANETDLVDKASDVVADLADLKRTATDRIAAQYAVLEKVSPQVWRSAQEASQIALELAERDRLDVAERLLFALDKGTRKTIGAYFTPQGLADQVVDRAAAQVRKNFGLANGFADLATRRELYTQLEVDLGAFDGTFDGELDRDLDQPFLCFADPAAGVGTFLLACVKRMKADFESRGTRQGDAPNGGTASWSEFLSQAIGRVRGIELHPALAAICQFRLFQHYETELGREPRSLIPIHCGDALCEPNQGANSKPDSKADENGMNAGGVSVVVGNPPFGSLTINSNSWIVRLLRGEIDGVSFFEIDGEPLRERKHWLHDDYVKFFRLGQYWIDRNAAGIVAFVSNRSYVDNLTFRGMRWQLLKQFREIEINELAASDQHFPIVANVAAAIFCTHAAGVARQQAFVDYRDRNQSTRFAPQAPEYLVRPTVAVAPHYRDAISIAEAMPEHGSVAITARDYFVTDLDRNALVDRIAEFCDMSIPDEVIRERYFQRTRSRRYPAGDTRGWKMSEVRQQLKEVDWESKIRLCNYRPFDRRWILWCDLMIDWPRNQQMSAFEIPGNFALLVRRQSPVDQAAVYFWASNRITIDGILRSDNRGNETMFPIWVRDSNGESVANFSPKFLERVRSNWQAMEVSFSENDLPVRLAQYIYGLFHCANYRTAFHQPLTSGFPRLLLSRSREETMLLIDAGGELLDCHLKRSDVSTGRPVDDGGNLVGSVSYCDVKNCVQFGGVKFTDVLPIEWNFRVGSHQVLKKWIKERKGQRVEPVSDEFREVLRLVRRTRESIARLEQVDFSDPSGWLGSE